MDQQTELPNTVPTPAPCGPVIGIIGVGNAGMAVLAALNRAEFAAAQFTAVNTDAGALTACPAQVKIHLENKLLRGLGSGGDPDRARALAEEQFSILKSACEGANVVFLLAGLGGGAGSGIGPVVAKAAHEAGALVLAFVTLPFEFEGNRREAQAQQALEQLRTAADGVICLPSQRISKLVDENTGALEMFRVIDNFLIQGVRGLWQLLTRPGLIQIHFADLQMLLQDRHAESAFAFVEASGPGRSREAVENILSHPLLDEGRTLAESEAVLVNLTAGTDLSMAEMNRVIDQVKRQCSQAQIIMGAALDPAMEDKLCVTVIAARPEASPGARRPQGIPGGGTTTLAADPPRLAAGTRETPAARPFSRARKAVNKPIQTQLPLTIVSKGRFDKSEPTKHNGQDLDVPTFIRRGISMN
jgi:cell division protein FtsZ